MLSSPDSVDAHPGFVGSGLTADRRGIRDDGRRDECPGSPDRTCVPKADHVIFPCGLEPWNASGRRTDHPFARIGLDPPGACRNDCGSSVSPGHRLRSLVDCDGGTCCRKSSIGFHSPRTCIGTGASGHGGDGRRGSSHGLERDLCPKPAGSVPEPGGCGFYRIRADDDRRTLHRG